MILSSCDDNSTETSSTGSLNGQTRLFDEKGNQIYDASGITVSLKENPVSATTTTSGAWHLKDVPMGTYTILFSKPGFDTAKIFGFQFNGYGDVRVDEGAELLKPAPGRIEQIMLSTRKAAGDTGELLIIKCTPSQDVILVEGSVRYVLKLSRSENSLWSENEDNSLYEVSQYAKQNLYENSTSLDFLKQKFGSGSRLYVTARVMHRHYGVRYDNFYKRYYVGLGQPSETITFIIP
ncbi:MAG: carboxypeptidase-like regulatory domain-containing protein [Bacteroidota bacterium]